MKKINPFYSFKNFAKMTLLFSIFLFGCSSDDPAPPPPANCNTTNTPFQQHFIGTLATDPLYSDNVTMDLLTHEYTFKMNSNETICSVGYQGNAVLYANNIPYLIEIVDVSTNTVIYSGNHVFNDAAIEYVSITPTNIVANQDYTIRRTVTNYLGNIGNTIGRILRFNGQSNSFSNPNIAGMSITASNFYGTGGPATDFGIPYIDIAFQ